MSPQEENFHKKLKEAPKSVRMFFQVIILYFRKDETTFINYTFSNGGDLRLAVQQENLSSKNRVRNYARLYWQIRKRSVFVRMYLNPNELALLGFPTAFKPLRSAESLLSELRLSELECQTDLKKFISALEQAKLSLLDTF